MAGEHVLSGLLRKREEIAWRVKEAAKALAVVEADLAAVDRTLALCGYEGQPPERARGRYKTLFKRGELLRLVTRLLRERGPMDDRALMSAVADAKDWTLAEGPEHEADILGRVRDCLQRAQKSGRVRQEFGEDGARWALTPPAANTLPKSG